MTSTEIGLRKNLPTMYDLPSEEVGEAGMPDQYHVFQRNLLRETLSLKTHDRSEWFGCGNLRVYYDVDSLAFVKPDWFLAVGVPSLYDGRDLRNSYVVWQEKRNPTIAIKFLSPGTEIEDLGRFCTPGRADPDLLDWYQAQVRSHLRYRVSEAANKLEAYEFLRIPHYVVHDRPTQAMRYFQLVGERYEERAITTGNEKIWFSDLQIGLGICEGMFEGICDHWLRWCDAEGNWLLTDTERAEQKAESECQQRDRAEAEKEALLAKLRAAGIDPEKL